MNSYKYQVDFCFLSVLLFKLLCFDETVSDYYFLKTFDNLFHFFGENILLKNLSTIYFEHLKIIKNIYLINF